MAGKTATTKIYLDKRHKSTDGTFIVKLRITNERKSQYYKTEIKLTETQYQQIMFGQRKTPKEKELYFKLQEFELKAKDCIDRIPHFTFEQFDKLYIQNRGATDTLEYAFSSYADYILSKESIGYAVSYKTTFNSLNRYKSGLRFVDITPTFLNNYEAAMRSEGKSANTISIYLRNLRVIFNKALRDGLIDQTLYPFGKVNYKIPTGTSFKRALSKEDITSIGKYEAKTEREQLAKDFWLLSYFCNGMNVVDILSLKRKNISGDSLYFFREKTKRSSQNTQPIKVHLIDVTKKIILKYGTKSTEDESYVFPFLDSKMSAEEKRNRVQLFTRLLNNYLKVIGQNLGLTVKLTTYTARHSFATALMRSGEDIRYIQLSLGHQNPKTTAIYLGEFDDETIRKNTESLLHW